MHHVARKMVDTFLYSSSFSRPPHSRLTYSFSRRHALWVFRELEGRAGVAGQVALECNTMDMHKHKHSNECTKIEEKTITI